MRRVLPRRLDPKSKVYTKVKVGERMVSVIVPVYNGATMIEQCLHSILTQSYTDLEVIVVNDGSTDDTNAICERIAQKDHRVRLLYQKNAGVSAARNNGIAIATGEYIAFVDADDYLAENGLAQMLVSINTEVDLVIGSYEAYRKGFSQKILRESRCFSFEALREQFAVFDGLLDTVWGKLYKKEIITQHSIGFDEQMPYAEDHVFNLQYCKRIKNAMVISEVVYFYRLGGLASSIKFHPQWNRYCMLLMNAYGAFFDGSENVPNQFVKKKISDLIVGSVAHYVVHCSQNEKEKKIQETLALFAPFISKDTVDAQYFSPSMARAILTNDAKALQHAILRKLGIRIMLRKAKIKYYQWFNKRI